MEGSRFLINDNGYRDYKFEAESPEMAAVWIHRIRLVYVIFVQLKWRV